MISCLANEREIVLTRVSTEGNIMMFRRTIGTLGTAGLLFAGLMGSAGSTSAAVPAAPASKVTICHRTGSATNPYVQITVSQAGAQNHLKNHDGTLNWPAAPY